MNTQKEVAILVGRVVRNFQSRWRIGWSRWGNLLIFNGITHQNCTKFEKVDGANDISRWRNRPAPPLADNPDPRPPQIRVSLKVFHRGSISTLPKLVLPLRMEIPF